MRALVELEWMKSKSLSVQAKKPAINAIGIYQRRQSLFAALPQRNDGVIFLGDSLIQTCEWSELLPLPGIQNRGIAGDTTDLLLQRLDMIVDAQPKHIVLMIGINDLRHQGCDIPSVLSGYEGILRRLTTELDYTQLLVHSVLPIHPQRFQARFKRSGVHVNTNVKEFNTQLQRIAQRYQCVYIDLTSLLMDSAGQLDLVYTTDGLHLSGKAYNVWAALLESHLPVGTLPDLECLNNGHQQSG